MHLKLCTGVALLEYLISEILLNSFSNSLNSFLSVDYTTGYCGQCKSRSDCTGCAVWSLIYTVHIFSIDCN